MDIDRLAQNHAFPLVVLASCISGISGVLIKNMSIATTSMVAIRSITPIILLGLFFSIGKKTLSETVGRR